VHAGIDEPTDNFATSVPALTKIQDDDLSRNTFFGNVKLNWWRKALRIFTDLHVDLYNEARVYTSHTLPLNSIFCNLIYQLLDSYCRYFMQEVTVL